MSKELLSAALDDAATPAEWDALIAALDDEPELTAVWSRSWQWRDLSNGVKARAPSDFCSKVMVAIANEVPLPSNVVQLPKRASPASQPALAARNWRTLVPLSAAAGIVAAVLVVGGLRSPSTELNPAVATSSSGLATIPVNFAADDTSRTVLNEEAKAAILNTYLMEHSNSLAERSMSGTLANARFVARTADYRPDSP